MQTARTGSENRKPRGWSWPSCEPNDDGKPPWWKLWKRYLFFDPDDIRIADVNYDEVPFTVTQRNESTWPTACLWIGFPAFLFGLWGAAMLHYFPDPEPIIDIEEHEEAVWAAWSLVIVGFWAIFDGFSRFVRRRIITVSDGLASVEERTLFGRYHWQEPLKAFSRLRPVYHSVYRRKFYMNATEYYYGIELDHPDAMRRLRLLKIVQTDENEKKRDAVMERLSALLNLPIIEDDPMAYYEST